MAMLQAVTAAALVLGAAVALAATPSLANPAFPCKYTLPDGSKTYDFSSLIAKNGSYVWSQQSYSVAGKNLYTISPDDVETDTYEIQLCGNVEKSISANCTSPSPANRISADGSCHKLGDINVSMWSPNPFADGAYLSMFGGDDVDHITKFQARFYFQCQNGASELRPYFEHSTSWSQAHFKLYTELAC